MNILQNTEEDNMVKKKSVKQHYNKILKDPKRRDQHFSKGGALGSEKEGREPGRVAEIKRKNEEAQDNLRHDSDAEAKKKLSQLKNGGKITL